jgi:hypothetical protein
MEEGERSCVRGWPRDRRACATGVWAAEGVLVTGVWDQ